MTHVPPKDAAAATTHAYEVIRAAILSGRFRPREHLREVPLGREFGMSRTPVRLALKRLAEDGFIVILPNRGAYVALWDARTLAEIADVRAHLSILAGRTAARRISKGDLDRLRAICVDLRTQIALGANDRDLDLCARQMLLFHDEVFRIADNRLLSQLFRQTTYVPVVHRTFRRFSDFDWDRVLAYLAQTVEAFEVGDGDCVGALMQAYFLMAKRAVVAAGDELNPDPASSRPRSGEGNGQLRP